MKKQSVFVLMVVIGLTVMNMSVFAQPEILWTRTFGGSESDGGFSVQQTTDGGYIIAGRFADDICLMKTNASGDSLWTRTFGGDDREQGWSVQQTTDGGYIIVGYTRSFGAGYYDVWLIKTDASGDSQWTRTFGGDSDDCGRSVQQTTDGGYIIVGYTLSFGAGHRDVWLIKTNASGDSLWTRTFGGGGEDVGNSVQQTTDGGYIIVGYTRSIGADFSDLWLIKTDALGNEQWDRIYGGTGTNEFGETVQQTTDGGYIIVGLNALYGALDYDVWLIRIDSETYVENESGPHHPYQFALHPVYPNPFNPITNIAFQLPGMAEVTLKVYNIMGQEVAKVIDGQMMSAGYHEAVFDGSELPSGIYFYQLSAGDYSAVGKMVLLK